MKAIWALVRSGITRDFYFVMTLSFLIFLLSSFFEFSEKLLVFTRPFEAYQIDEVPIALFSLVIGLLWLLRRRSKQALDELQLRVLTQKDLAKVLGENRLLSQKYINLQEEERRMLARELHDELGQGLNAIKIDAVNIREDSRLGSAVRESADSIIEVSSDIYQLVRNLTHRLRPVALDELGLTFALSHLLDSWEKRNNGISCKFNLEGSLDGLPESVNITLFRFVQEGLTNIIKHSEAHNVNITLNHSKIERNSLIKITISDDGVGVDLTRPRDGLGLVGLRERVEALGGTFKFYSNEVQRGFTITASIPL